MGIYVKFTMITHQIWSCHVTLASNSENFHFFAWFYIKFYETLPNLGEFGSITKTLQAKIKLGVVTIDGGNPPVLRVKGPLSTYLIYFTFIKSVAINKDLSQPLR